MNTTEVSKKTGYNNEEKMSEDKSQNSKEFKNKLTDQEVNQIIDNIASGSCGDQISNIEKNDNGESKTGQSIIVSIPADNVHTTTEVPSPNDECDSQDEDILLRWDDDEDEQASQEKIDEDILNDLDSVDSTTNNDVKNLCVLLDDSNDPNTDASKDKEYKVNNDAGTDTPIENTGINKDLVIAEDDDSDDVVIKDSNDPMIILSDDESSAPDKNAFHQVIVEKLPKDDEQNSDKTVVKEEIKSALSNVDNESKENDEGKSSMKIENTFEENTNDNIDFLKQQLKVLSESINPNLSSNSIDVSNILGTEFGTTSANVIGALDGFGEPVSNDDSKCSFEVDIKPRVGVDVDIFPDETDQNIVQTISLEVQNDTNTDKEHVMTGIKMEFEISSVNVQDSLFVKEERTMNCSDDLEGSVKDVVIESVKTEVDDMSEATNIESNKTELETAKEDPEKDIQTKPSEDMEVVSSELTNIEMGESITEKPLHDIEKEPSEVEITDIAEEMNVEKTDVIDQDANCVEIEKSNKEFKIGDSEATNTANIEITTEKPLTDIKTTDLEISKDVSAFEAINIETDNKPEETLKESETKPSDEDMKESTDAIGAETTNIATESDNDDDKTVSTEEMVVDNSESTAEADSKTSECDNYVDLRSQSPISLDNESMHTENAVESIDPKTTTKNDPENKNPLNYYNVKTDNILRPDVMIEIPTQNLIDVDTDDYLDMDSEETSQDGDTKVEATKEKENIENKNEQTAQKDGSKDNQTENLSNLDVIDVDMDDDSAGETETKTNEVSPNQEIESNEKDNDDSKEITNPEISERTQSNEENIIDLDDYDTELTEKDPNLTETENKEAKLDVDEASTSVRRMSPDAIDEVPDATDSLGLLAESSRVRRDEDMEEEFYEDDDFEYDESSNQMTAEHSEDSNPQHSETDSKDQEDKSQESRAFHFTECEVVGGADNEGAEAEKDESSVNVNNAIEVNEVADNTELEKLNEQDASVCDMETFKLSDASDNEGEPTEQKGDEKTKEKSPEKTLKSPSKTKKLEIANPRHVLNIVDLEESSSEEDVQEEQTDPPQEEPEEVDVQDKEPEVPSDVTSVNIPTEIEIMSNSCGNTSEIVTKEGEVVISGVPKPPPHKPARLNTSEVTIKTASPAKESTLIIPETKMAESKPKVGLEIFNLDSDDEDIGSANKEGAARAPLSALELDAALRAGRCVRRGCGAGARGGAALALYCDHCAALHLRRTQELVEGVKNMTPLLELNMDKLDQDLVEISDSESEEEPDEPTDRIGEDGAKILEENLADILNSMWRKYKMDASLLDAKALLDAEMERLENETKEIHKMLNECQASTDKLRGDLYATFEPQREQLPAIHIYDNADIMTVENENVSSDQTSVPETRQAKRRLSASNIQPAKRPAIPLGYAPLDNEANQIGQQEHTTILRVGENNRFDDDPEVSVVQLSAEAAPRELPAPGEVARAPLRAGMPVFAMANNGHWYKARIVDQVRFVGPQPQFPSYRVRFEKRVKNPCKVVSARHLAYSEPADVRLTIGTRVIALFKETTNTNKKNTYSSGIIAEIPNPVNNYRYLVFFDDGYAQYAAHALTRVVCAAAAPVWDEVHPFSREFVRTYLCAYPERPMVRLHAGQTLNTEWNGKWWESRVIQVDASLVQVYFEEDKRTEWIYRGSTRLEPLFLELQAAVKPRGRHVPRTKAMGSINMPYVEYTRSYEQEKSFDAQEEELRLQRAVAKKSTALAAPGAQEQQDPFISRVVYYTPRNAVRPYKMTTHNCGPKCKRTDVLSLQELRSYNPLAKPLLSGWERQLVRNKGVSCVLYRAPCGRRLRSARELHRYLRATRSDLPVDLFDFSPDTHCLAEYVLAKFIVGKKDLSHGKENVPVPCVNMVDTTLPEFCSYNTERTPTAGVPLNLDPDFLCGCDCTDDCEDKTKCACWKLTLEGAKTIGMEGPNIGYDYKRLPEPLPSGIYECNVRCKCKHTCLNRVAQHPLQLKLQVFKTPNRGWGIRALNDVPKGAFLCVYAGNLLTDATANLDGLNEGDEYLAELDYIEVVEQMKEGYEDDVPEADKILDQKEAEVKEEKSEEEESSSSEEEEVVSKNEEQDDDFRPGYIGLGVMEFNKRLRKRGKEKKEQKEEQKEEMEKGKESNAEDDCITISDDEEVREPSRFTAQTEMGANEHVPKYRSVRSYFGKDEACYIMDAKVQGNIGRYLNHSCSPNVFVQNVFVDTHDPRFPWVAFFALSHIRAGTELTWNYNYDVGSVPGKVLYCYCGAPNCRRRLL